MIKLEFDHNNHATSALQDSNSLSTPFSVKDILNFVDQSEGTIESFVDCSKSPISPEKVNFHQETTPTMDYCDNNRINGAVEAPQYLYHHQHHHHYHHQQSGYFHGHQTTTPGTNFPPQFGYSDLCDYNANYYASPYAPNTYSYGTGAGGYPLMPPPPSSANNCLLRPLGYEEGSSPAVKSDFNEQPSPGNSTSSLLSSPHAQQMDTMCQELENGSRSRRFYKYSWIHYFRC